MTWPTKSCNTAPQRLEETAGGYAIPLCVPELGGREWEYLKECLETNWVSSAGPFVERFERTVASFVGTRHAVATASGTAALHVALLVAGVQPDEEVLVSTLSFIAPANAIRYVGAWPVFIDADPTTWQMDPERVDELLTRRCRQRGGALVNRASRRRVRAILPVHILGHPCDTDPLIELARRYDLVVIGDATESLGATYRGRRVGVLGDAACFSFNGNKIVTTGGGGMFVTDNLQWAERARYLTTQAKDDPVESIHREVGYNYRLTNLQAALGCAQLERLEDHIAAKRRIAQAYAGAFADVPGITVMPEAPWASSIFWLYTILVEEAGYGMNSRHLRDALAQSGIESRPLWQPLHRSPAHRGSEVVGGTVAQRLASKALCLPSSVGLRAGEQHRVIETVRHLATQGEPARFKGSAV